MHTIHSEFLKDGLLLLFFFPLVQMKGKIWESGEVCAPPCPHRRALLITPSPHLQLSFLIECWALEISKTKRHYNRLALLRFLYAFPASLTLQVLISLAK